MSKHRNAFVPTAAMIRDFFAKTSRPTNLDDVLRILHISRSHKKHVIFLLNALTENGVIVRLRGGRFIDAKMLRTVRGVLSVQRTGANIVTPERHHGINNFKNIFIHKNALNGAWHNDIVEVTIMPSSDQRGNPIEGRIVSIINRRTTELAVCPVPMRGYRRRAKQPLFISDYSSASRCLCRPIDIRYDIMFDVDISDLDRIPQKDELIIVEPIAQIADCLWEARAKKIIAKENDTKAQELLTRINHSIPLDFPPDVEAEAASISIENNLLPSTHSNISGHTEKKDIRTDLRNLPFVTIDGENARDFDDAVYVEMQNGQFVLWVAIADVGLYVRPHTAIDREALSRGNSYYFPTSVTPMLPEILCNNLCSLRQGEDRPVMAVRIIFDKHGTIRTTDFTQAIICSQARLTYTEVQNHYDGTKHLNEPMASMLDKAKLLAETLIARRHESGGLDFDLPEAQFILKNDIVIAVSPRQRLFAHRLIEVFMIAANEAVAQFLTKKRIPFPLRAHPAPTSERLESLFAFLQMTELSDKIPGKISEAKTIGTILEAAKGTPNAQIVSRLILRSMMQARYIVGPNKEPEGHHFGLASPCYCHFTSPIRRYADLMVHRALKYALNTPDTVPIPTPQNILSNCERCNEQERTAQEAEREINKRLTCLLLKQHIGDIFKAVVSGVMEFGFFVEPEGWLADGMVHVGNISDDWFYFDAKLQRLIGQSTGQIIKLGDKIDVRLQSVDIENLKIDFIPVNFEYKTNRRQYRPRDVDHAKIRKNEQESFRGRKQARAVRQSHTKKPSRHHRHR